MQGPSQSLRPAGACALQVKRSCRVSSVCRSSRLSCAASAEKARIAVLGASGYTGAEVMRLMAHHPGCIVTALTGESNAGKVCWPVYSDCRPSFCARQLMARPPAQMHELTVPLVADLHPC